MAITPQDIQAQTFSEAKRGYDPAEVDVFLEQLASEVDAMLSKIVDLKGRLTATEQQLADAQAQLAAQPAVAPAPAPAPQHDYSATERQISAALIAAQQTADQIVADAQQNAQRICDEADAKARDVIRQALQEKQNELAEIDRLKASREEFKSEYLKLIQHFMDDALDVARRFITDMNSLSNAKTVIDTAYPGFTQTLLSEFSWLRNDDLHLIVLTCFGYPNGTVSSLLHISEANLAVRRTRLARKMGLDESLTRYLKKRLCTYKDSTK